MALRFANFNSLTLASFVGLIIGSLVRADDWPCWRGPRLDGISKETGLLTEWPKDGPTQLWKVKLSGGFSSVVVVEDRAYTQTRDKNQEIVLCLDAATGQEIWRYGYACDYGAHPTFTGGGMPPSRTGPRATPTVNGGRIYTLGATGILLCLDARTGKPIWRQELLKIADRTCPTHGYCGCPLVMDGRIYLQPGGADGKAIAALDANDGRLLWQALDDPLAPSSPIWAVVVGVPQVIFFTGKGLAGVAPQDGKLLWSYPWQTRFDLNISTPIYSDGKVFISSNYGTGGALVRLTDKPEPVTVWKALSMQNHFSTSVLYEGCLYGFSERRFRCVDFETGKVKWDNTGLGRGSLIVADGHLIILGEHGQLVLARPDPQAYTEVSRCQVLPKEALSWTVPALSNCRLFARSENVLVAFDLRKATN
jgi:outer membrane protein assembly factor BamB